jgi:hypothetical protein
MIYESRVATNVRNMVKCAMNVQNYSICEGRTLDNLKHFA